MTKIREERIKLFAIYFNTMAAGSMVAGVLAPALNVALGEHPTVFPVAYFALAAFVLSIILHSIAQLILGRLSP